MKIILQHLAPQHLLSRAAGILGNSRCVKFKNFFIQWFISRFRVDMSTAVEENPKNYASFNDFFTRLLKRELRPIVAGKNEIACPVDGCVSQIGKIDKNAIFQAKGFNFDLSALVGSAENAKQFIDGAFATFYLAPKDYHRVHMPLAGKCTDIIYIPGKLFSVNQHTTRHVPNLFSRNERIVCLFETEFGPMAVILVGAMIVGSINISCKKGDFLQKGDEVGYFKMGSTVIVLFGKDKANWMPSLKEYSVVKMGALIGNV